MRPAAMMYNSRMDNRPTLDIAGARWTDRAPAASNARTAQMLSNARELRANMSLPEVLLWQQLRGKRLLGLKFRRQHVIGQYIADFYCHELRLVIEVDGRGHETKREDDRARDAWMDEQGFTMVRLPARMVLSEIEASVNEIAQAALRLMPVLRERVTRPKTL